MRILFSALLLFTAVGGPADGHPRNAQDGPRLLDEVRRPLNRVLDAPAPTHKVSVTETTALFLDGKRCRMEDVPEGALVERLELAGDGKTATRIDFRSPTPKARAK